MGEKSLADPQQAFSTLALYAASQVVHSKLWALEYFIHPNHVQTKTAPMLRSVSRDERAGFVSYKGLLKIKPCCWKSRWLWGAVGQSMPTLRTRGCVLPRRTQQRCHRKESPKLFQSPSTKRNINYISLHSFDNIWFVFPSLFT